MKNLRHHIRAKAKHGEKNGYVYADVVDSLDNYSPVCASLPYYVVTCSNCMNYVHQCLNCVYDKPKEVPTVIPEYLSTPYLPEYPSFPAYPVQQDQQEQEDQQEQQQQQQEQQQQHGEGEQEEQEHGEGEQEEQEHGELPTASHIQTLLDSLRTGLPTLEQGLYTIQTDISKIQAHLPGGAGTEDSWPSGYSTMSDEGTLNNIADHTDVGVNGPHLNHIMTIIKSIQSTLPDYQKDMKQLQRDLARCAPPLMSEPATSEPVSE